VSKSPKANYSSPELRVYGTLRQMTLTGNGSVTDSAGSCAPGQGCHSTAAK
jgi:hypothetical protein